MRTDKNVHADIGLNKTFLELAFAYELPYLKLGLEVVFGLDEITLNGPDTNSTNTQGATHACATGDKQWKNVLKKVVQDRLLSDVTIQAQPQFSKEKLLFPEAQNELRRQLCDHFVKKFLALVLVIDSVRMNRLLGSSCLFTLESGVKSSKQVLINFCMEFLQKQGDFPKYLENNLQYEVFFEQTLRDEFDYSVSSLMCDLRDGVRLARLAEILTGTEDVTVHLRTPAVSRLQKQVCVCVPLSLSLSVCVCVCVAHTNPLFPFLLPLPLLSLPAQRQPGFDQVL